MGEERETPTQRKRENRRQCERGTQPSLPPPRVGTSQVLPSIPQGSVGMGVLLKDQAPALYKAAY